MFYSAYDFHKTIANGLSKQFSNMACGLNELGFLFSPAKSFAAPFTFLSRLVREYDVAPFGVHEVEVDGQSVQVNERVLCKQPFGELLNFKKDRFQNAPPMLVIAPMSGHYASLLNRSVKPLIRNYNVYITDWINPRYIPSSKGDFGLEDFTQYICDFIGAIIEDTGRRPHVLAICQPTAELLVAVSHLASIGGAVQAASIILMGGPVDVRRNMTDVCKFADSYPISWFEDNVIATVPAKYPGAFRRVYPGYLQHLGFINMHPDNHIKEHFLFYEAVIENNEAFIRRHINFYDSYHAVMDMTEKFYIETIKIVFQEHSLAEGNMEFKGKRVDLGCLTNLPLMVVEAERDDICAPGQTSAAFDLCRNIPDDLKEYLLVKGAGHYGVFSGSRWEKDTSYRIKSFTDKYN